MDIESLQLRRIRDYTQEIPISPLVFQSERLRIQLNAWSEKLESIVTTKGTYVGNFQISENEYDRIICPVTFVQANVGNKGREGFINGIIKPDMLDDGIILPNAPQRFHCYYEHQDKALLGLSSKYMPGLLSAQFFEWNNDDYQKFKQSLINPKDKVPPWFEVKNEYEKNPDIRKYGNFFII